MVFKPGRSGNPPGRPKGARGLAYYIRELTDQFRDLADTLYAIATDEEQAAKDRVAAVNALLDRGLGKPFQAVEMAVAVSHEERPPEQIRAADYSRLSPAELASLHELRLASARLEARALGYELEDQAQGGAPRVKALEAAVSAVAEGTLEGEYEEDDADGEDDWWGDD